MKTKLILILVLLTSVLCLPALAQGTAFTYQGRLDDGANAANGIYDLRFTIYDSSGGAGVLAGPITNSPVAVSNGLFTVTLDFGAGVFVGSARWLEIGVRSNGGAGFTLLAPRTEITPAPYAIHAFSVDSTGLSGTFSKGVTFDNPANVFVGSFTGDGAGVTNVDAATLGGLSAANFWQLGGNAGTIAGVNFIGTTDAQALEFKVNGLRALRLENAPGIPNLIGGAAENSVLAGIQGATIAGGGLAAYPNSITASWATIGGGTFHIAGGEWATIGGGRDNRAYSESSTVAGGYANIIEINAPFSAIGGGLRNVLESGVRAAVLAGGESNRVAGNHSTVSGGIANTNTGLGATIGGGNGNATAGNDSTVSGGTRNRILASSHQTTIGGGGLNFISSNSWYSTIGGGHQNTISNNTQLGTIAGGERNSIGRVAPRSTIGGGFQNAIGDDTPGATVAGGWLNVVGTNSDYSTIGGGERNVITDNVSYAAIAGGYTNRIDVGSSQSFIGGGALNTVSSNSIFATIAGGELNTVGLDASHSTIGGGASNNIADNSSSTTIGGGQFNYAAGGQDTISGGMSNSNSSPGATIAGGERNLISTNSSYGAIGGGADNTIETDAHRSTIGGGFDNTIQTNASDSTIGGGFDNTIQTNALRSTIGGGYYNTIEADARRSTIGGGVLNTIQTNAYSSTIGGGLQNTIQTNAYYSTIGGGVANKIETDAPDSTIGGGIRNTIQTNAYQSTISGGFINTIQTNAYSSTIGGGALNTNLINASYATIPGGYLNVATNYAFAAGRQAKAIHQGAFVWADSTGGDFASTGDNQFNVRASGGARFVTGGAGLSVDGVAVLAGSIGTAQLLDGSVTSSKLASSIGVWTASGGNVYRSSGRAGIGTTAPEVPLHVAGGTDTSLGGGGYVVSGNTAAANISIDDNEIMARNNGAASTLFLNANGGTVAVGAIAGMVDTSYALHVIGDILASGTITPSSDRHLKKNLDPVNPQEVLERVVALPIQRWTYKTEDDAVRHVGPMAQDFHAAFGLGANDVTIATVDADGVALAAIQGLNQKIEARGQRSEVRSRILEERLEQKETEITELKQRLDKLEQLLTQLSMKGH